MLFSVIVAPPGPVRITGPLGVERRNTVRLRRCMIVNRAARHNPLWIMPPVAVQLGDAPVDMVMEPPMGEGTIWPKSMSATLTIVPGVRTIAAVFAVSLSIT